MPFSQTHLAGAGFQPSHVFRKLVEEWQEACGHCRSRRGWNGKSYSPIEEESTNVLFYWELSHGTRTRSQGQGIFVASLVHNLVFMLGRRCATLSLLVII